MSGQYYMSDGNSGLKTLPLTTSCSTTPLLSGAADPPEIFISEGAAVALHAVVERKGLHKNRYPTKVAY